MKWMKIEGMAVKLMDNIDTDVILPGKYLTLTDYTELAKHALEGIDPAFSEKAGQGVIIVAGENFGCGSSREHAPIALKYAGVKSIIAKSFARIFFRNAINIGLPVIESKEASSQIREEDHLLVDLKEGTVTDTSLGKSFKVPPLPGFLLKLIEDGGLVAHLRKTGIAGR